MSSDDQGRDSDRTPDGKTNPHAQRSARKRLRIKDILPSYEDGILRGTHVLTADGTLPVEYLEAGDRIVTRAGMRTLRRLDIPAPDMFKLAFDRAEIVYADGIQFDSQTGKAFAA
ncbi:MULTISPECIES: Hint domain-containing protein [Pacificibacter]|uniref:Hint domain-containing protein n=1 Tax=Pacificibacter TaxID=1042323 RepID=UPI001C09665A|nr:MULTISPECIES: Hint domain-containing protein [Pacificibacter]MBU2935504.1 Hint domain-containing protein [Pacificibacter marinus]MDO6614001.1 Hint domain-containing protein [Pacificibacter sp. 1_MG-2023]